MAPSLPKISGVDPGLNKLEMQARRNISARKAVATGGSQPGGGPTTALNLPGILHLPHKIAEKMPMPYNTR